MYFSPLQFNFHCQCDRIQSDSFSACRLAGKLPRVCIRTAAADVNVITAVVSPVANVAAVAVARFQTLLLEALCR